MFGLACASSLWDGDVDIGASVFLFHADDSVRFQFIQRFVGGVLFPGENTGVQTDHLFEKTASDDPSDRRPTEFLRLLLPQGRPWGSKEDPEGLPPNGDGGK